MQRPMPSLNPMHHHIKVIASLEIVHFGNVPHNIFFLNSCSYELNKEKCDIQHISYAGYISYAGLLKTLGIWFSMVAQLNQVIVMCCQHKTDHYLIQHLLIFKSHITNQSFVFYDLFFNFFR